MFLKLSIILCLLFFKVALPETSTESLSGTVLIPPLLMLELLNRSTNDTFWSSLPAARLKVLHMIEKEEREDMKLTTVSVFLDFLRERYESHNSEKVKICDELISFKADLYNRKKQLTPSDFKVVLAKIEDLIQETRKEPMKKVLSWESPRSRQPSGPKGQGPRDFLGGNRYFNVENPKPEPVVPTRCVACLFQEYDDCVEDDNDLRCSLRKPNNEHQCTYRYGGSPPCVSRFKDYCEQLCQQPNQTEKTLCVTADRRQWDEVVNHLKQKGCPQDPEKTIFVMKGHGEYTSALTERIKSCAAGFGKCGIHSEGCQDGRRIGEIQTTLYQVLSSCPDASLVINANQCIHWGDISKSGVAKFVLDRGSCTLEFPPCEKPFMDPCVEEEARYCTHSDGSLHCDVCKKGVKRSDLDNAHYPTGLWEHSDNLSACEEYMGVVLPRTQYASGGLNTRLYKYYCHAKCLGDNAKLDPLPGTVQFSFRDIRPEIKPGPEKAMGEVAEQMAIQACRQEYAQEKKIALSEIASLIHVQINPSSCFRSRLGRGIPAAKYQINHRPLPQPILPLF